MIIWRRLAVAALAAGVGAIVARKARRLAERRRRIRWSPPGGAVRHDTLAVRTLGETGRPIILLHGLTASNRYWGATFDTLARHGRLIVPDLLGFGASPRPPVRYSGPEHAKAVAACLQELGATNQPALIGAHSMGCIVALHIAHEYPELVASIVAFAPPLYSSRAAAESHIAGLGYMARMFVPDTPLARMVCQLHERLVCEHPALVGAAAALLRADLPAPIARDGVRHTWASYSQSLEHLILAADAAPLVETAGVPIRFVVGTADPVVELPLLEHLAAECPHVSSVLRPGEDHDLLLTTPDRAVDELRDALRELQGATSP